jgi:hypothetical protein
MVDGSRTPRGPGQGRARAGLTIGNGSAGHHALYWGDTTATHRNGTKDL